MAKFKKGETVSYTRASTYIGGGNCDNVSDRGGFSGEAIKSTSSGVFVKTELGTKEFIHRNRITNY